MTQTKLVIFDCDGVLVDSEVVGCRVLSHYLDACGIKASIEQCAARYAGRSAHGIRELVEADSGIRLPDTFVSDVRRNTLQELSKGVIAIPGIKECLDEIRTDYRVCVASSGLHVKIRQSLDLSGLTDYFGTYLFSTSDVENGKPAPDLFQHAAKNMGVPPELAIVIEDSEAGVRGAVAAGMVAVGFIGGSHVQTGHEDVLHQAGAARVINDMRALPEIIRRLA